ncbi:hypothetical protein J6S88_03550 [bacterium]|nr:hypothetical protein [bacterium]
MNVKQISPSSQVGKAIKRGTTIVLAVVMDAKTRKAYESDSSFREKVDRFERTHDGDITLVATNQHPDEWSDRVWYADVIAIANDGNGHVTTNKIDNIEV